MKICFKHIFKQLNFFLLHLAVLILLFVNTGMVKEITASPTPHKETTEEKVEKETLASDEDAEEEKERAVITESALEAVVPFLNINLSYSFKLIFSFDYPIVENNFPSTEAVFIPIPYFEELFEHFIVINAP